MLLIIDGHALIYRAYHAFPELSTPEGALVNAVYGFTRILLTSIRDFEPEYVAVAFDAVGPTNRSLEYEEYKANRAEMPQDLQAQIPIIKDVVTALNIPQFEVQGIEADDIIGTITTRLAEQQSDLEILVVTGDKDLLQLVTDQTHVFIPRRGNKFSKDIEYDPATVLEKLGVKPSQVVELKALMGDSSDNIKGIKGVGKKTATSLIQYFGSVAKLYTRLSALEAGDAPTPAEQALLKPALVRKLSTGQADAQLSKELATIQRDVAISFKIEDCKLSGYHKAVVQELFEKLGFDSLYKLLPADDFELSVEQALF